MKSYIDLSSCHLTCTGQPAHQAGFIGACQLGPQNENVGISKNFLPLVLVIKVVQNIFFPETYFNASTFLSLDSRCVSSMFQGTLWYCDMICIMWKIGIFFLNKLFVKIKDITKISFEFSFKPHKYVVNMHPNPNLPLPASIHSKSFCVLYFIPIVEAIKKVKFWWFKKNCPN